MQISWAFIFSLFHGISCINVVIFLPGTTEDERRPLKRFAQHLAFKNHGVATFKCVLIPEERYLVKPKLHMVREIQLQAGLDKELYQSIQSIGDEAPWSSHYEAIEYQKPLWMGYTKACEAILSSDLMDRLKSDSYDVALVYSGQPCHLAVVHALAIPFIYYDMAGFSDETVAAARLPMSPGIIPASVSTIQRPQTWTERWENFMLMFEEFAPHLNEPWLAEAVSARYRSLDKPINEIFRNDSEIKKLFPEFPDVNAIKEEAALYFVNSDPLLEFAGHPTGPNVIYVGGAHMEHPKPLFEPWNVTMKSAKEGVIIISFGIVANSSAMPSHMLRAFVEAIRRMPDHRFYMRISSDTLPGFAMDELPPNLNITRHLPQIDLLADPQTKLMITNGGMNTVMECLYAGVPILGIPLFGMNYNSLRKVEAQGFGRILEKSEITAKRLESEMKEMLQNKDYFRNAKKMSKAFKDRPMTAFETAIFWIEYVGKNHRGPEFHRSPPMTIFSLAKAFMLDLFAAIFATFLITIFFIMQIFHFCRRIFYGAPAPAPVSNPLHANGSAKKERHAKKKSNEKAD